MKQIQHVQQIHPLGCMSACLAMVTGRPVKEIMDEFHNLYWKKKLKPEHILIKHGVKFEYEKQSLDTALGSLDQGVYILSAPSLNAFNSMHAVVVDSRRARCITEAKIYDPARGTGADYYKQFGDGDFDLRHWQIVAEIHMERLLH